MMEEALSYFFNIDDVVDLIVNSNGSFIMDLSSWSGVESTSVQDNDVVSFFFEDFVFNHCHNFRIKSVESVVDVV